MKHGHENIVLSSDIGVAAAMEAKRLANKYKKDYLNCDDLVKIMGIGKHNVRHLFNSDDFPSEEIRGRRVVSIIAFVVWSLRNCISLK